MQDTERGDGASHTDRDPDSNIVDFDGPSDPAKAVNWTRSKKWANIIVLSTMTFITCEHLPSP